MADAMIEGAQARNTKLQTDTEGKDFVAESGEVVEEAAGEA
jgi:hypothetical protein